MARAHEISRDKWVVENGKVLLFCPKCGSEHFAHFNEDSQSFHMICESDNSSVHIAMVEADFYQPTWP